VRIIGRICTVWGKREPFSSQNRWYIKLPVEAAKQEFCLLRLAASTRTQLLSLLESCNQTKYNPLPRTRVLITSAKLVIHRPILIVFSLHYSRSCNWG
jgi:hypothetical protein